MSTVLPPGARIIEGDVYVIPTQEEVIQSIEDDIINGPDSVIIPSRTDIIQSIVADIQSKKIDPSIGDKVYINKFGQLVIGDLVLLSGHMPLNYVNIELCVQEFFLLFETDSLQEPPSPLPPLSERVSATPKEELPLGDLTQEIIKHAWHQQSITLFMENFKALENTDIRWNDCWNSAFANHGMEIRQHIYRAPTSEYNYISGIGKGLFDAYFKCYLQNDIEKTKNRFVKLHRRTRLPKRWCIGKPVPLRFLDNVVWGTEDPSPLQNKRIVVIYHLSSYIFGYILDSKVVSGDYSCVQYAADRMHLLPKAEIGRFTCGGKPIFLYTRFSRNKSEREVDKISLPLQNMPSEAINCFSMYKNKYSRSDWRWNFVWNYFFAKVGLAIYDSCLQITTLDDTTIPCVGFYLFKQLKTTSSWEDFWNFHSTIPNKAENCMGQKVSLAALNNAKWKTNLKLAQKTRVIVQRPDGYFYGDTHNCLLGGVNEWMIGVTWRPQQAVKYIACESLGV